MWEIMLQISGCVSMLRFKKWDSLVRTRSEESQLAEATLTNHMSLRRVCQKGEPCPLSFLDSLFPGNIARIARLALLEWGICDIKFKRISLTV